jgi:hypothetical protein
MAPKRCQLISLLVLCVAGCNVSGNGRSEVGPGNQDGGSRDAGLIDASLADSGGLDGGDGDGGFDASTVMDAGPPRDAGAVVTGPPDASDSDAGSMADAGIAPRAPCGGFGNLPAEWGAVIDLGHANPITSLSRLESRLVSSDSAARWVLWNPFDHTLMASGTLGSLGSGSDRYYPPIVAAGEHMAQLTARGDIQVRSVFDGTVLATVPGGFPFGLATDGSYVWVAGLTALTAWDTQGTLLAQLDGDYRTSHVFAAPGELRVGGGPVGASVVQKVSTATGEVISSSIAGSFHSWFLDGDRFLTTVSTTVRVYDTPTTAQQLIAVLPTTENLTGQGDYFWTHDNTVDIYAVADASAPALRQAAGGLATLVPTGSRLAVLPYGQPSMTVIELGASLTTRTIDLPLTHVTAVAFDKAGDWVIGNSRGGVVDAAGIDHALSCGVAMDVAGSASGTFAVATAAGGILLFEHDESGRTAYLGRLSLTSSHVALSRDGGRLAAAASIDDSQYTGDRSVKVFALPELTQLKVWPYEWMDGNPDVFLDFSMSSNGARFGHVVGTSPHTHRVLDLDDNVSLMVTSDSAQPPRLSADGTLVAVAAAGYTASNLYQGGTLFGVVPGEAAAWVDDQHLLVHARDEMNRVRARIYDTQGNLQPGFDLPELGEVTVISTAAVYSEQYNAIYSLATGDTLFSGVAADRGAVAADQVVYSPRYTHVQGPPAPWVIATPY